MFHGIDHDNQMHDWVPEYTSCAVVAVRKNAEQGIPDSERGITFVRMRRRQPPR